MTREITHSLISGVIKSVAGMLCKSYCKRLHELLRYDEIVVEGDVWCHLCTQSVGKILNEHFHFA